jgi:hypothetical protein
MTDRILSVLGGDARSILLRSTPRCGVCGAGIGVTGTTYRTGRRLGMTGEFIARASADTTEAFLLHCAGKRVPAGKRSD